MPDSDSGKAHKRTAVLVVHGIGSQRALETVRGVIKGVWLDGENPYDAGGGYGAILERDGADIDLTVMTTNEVPESKDERTVDFHELYWAHLMSETKPVAVLLWLYELCRKGPIMKEGINGLWWAAAIFLCLMNLSFALLVLKGAVVFAQLGSVQNHAGCAVPADRQLSRLRSPDRLEMASVTACEETCWFCVIGVIVIAVYFVIEIFPLSEPTAKLPDAAELGTIVALPTLIALDRYLPAHRQHGLRAFWRALLYR